MSVFNYLAPYYNFIFYSVQERQGIELMGALAPLKDKKILDIGGGTGNFAAQMFSKGADVWLLDSSPHMLKRASGVLPSEKVVLGDAQKLPFPESSFDIITLVDAFHHIREQKTVLNECYRVLQSKGRLCMLEFSPHRMPIKILRIVERIFGEPALFLSSEELERKFRVAQFEQIEVKYILKHEYIIQGIKV